MVVFPVLVLTEGSAVTGDVAAAARLGCFATAVPAALARVLLLGHRDHGFLRRLAPHFADQSLHPHPLHRHQLPCLAL